MAGVSDRSARASRSTAQASADTADQALATGSGSSQGGETTPPGGDGTAPTTPPAATDSGGEVARATSSEILAATSTASTVQAAQIEELLDRVAALTADNADLQARLASEQARSAVDEQDSILSRPSLDALLAGQVDKTVWRIAVVGPAQGRWRIGRRFGPEEQTFVEGELTDDELKALRSDPLLTIGVSQVRVHAVEAM